MNIRYFVAVIMLGQGLASLAILTSDQVFQNAVAGLYVENYDSDDISVIDSTTNTQIANPVKIANPSGVNMAGNMTGNATGLGEQNIPTANTTGVETVAVTPWTD